jgi:uncharacterized membrane protein
LHLLVSGTRLRGALTRLMGEGVYMGLFSLASVGGLTWLGFAYAAARGEGEVWWAATDTTKLVQLGLTLLAFLLIVPGLTTPNPTSVKQEGALSKPNAVQGMLRITRHPFLWGVAIWAAGHILVNGDAPSLLLFGGMLVLAVAGTFSIDHKRMAALGSVYEGFKAQTANLPFAAILAGRQKLSLAEIGWWRLLLAVVIWAAVVSVHKLAFGVSPMPGG